MRILGLLALAASTAAASAAPGLPTDRFSTTWTSVPTAAFSPGLSSFAPIAAHAAEASLVDGDALRPDTPGERRDLAINAMASGWGQAQRSALQRLRDAQRAYAAAAEIVHSEPDRDAGFVATLVEVVEGTGRSVATNGGRDADVVLDQVYAGTIRAADDEALPKIEAAERAWIAYRDAFGDLAEALDRPDAALTVRAELVRRRLGELQAAPSSAQ